MEFEKTRLNDLIIIKPKVYGDSRGYFLETWSQKNYAAIGVLGPFVQDNTSFSRSGILRGLHFQKQYPQGKLVYVSLGEVFDVVVDIRSTSSTFGKWYGVNLSEINHHQLWIPPGFAHGFCVLSKEVLLHYKCTEYYHPEDEGSLLWNDKDIGIDWPVSDPELSAKDQVASSWKEYLEKFSI